MKHKLFFQFRLLQHYFLSRSKFDIHSPFVYKIYSEIIKDKTDYAGYHPPIKITSNRNTPLSRKDYRLLYRLSRYFKTTNILILGTPDGTTASYLASGSPAGCLTSIHDSIGLNADSGMFDMVFVSYDLPGTAILDFFPHIIQHIHNDSVLIFCNSHGSKEMHDVWNKIKKHSSVTLTIDLFNLGLVFCKEELTKEDFILRY